MYEINKLHHGEGMCTACLKRMKALFKTVLYFLSEAKNVRISYVYETHEIEFIMPGSLMTGLNPEQFCGVYFDYTACCDRLAWLLPYSGKSVTVI